MTTTTTAFRRATTPQPFSMFALVNGGFGGTDDAEWFVGSGKTPERVVAVAAQTLHERYTDLYVRDHARHTPGSDPIERYLVEQCSDWSLWSFARGPRVEAVLRPGPNGWDIVRLARPRFGASPTATARPLPLDLARPSRLVVGTAWNVVKELDRRSIDEVIQLCTRRYARALAAANDQVELAASWPDAILWADHAGRGTHEWAVAVFRATPEGLDVIRLP